MKNERLTAEEVALKVYNPAGAYEITQGFAPRLSNLNGKTICELSDGVFEADRMFPLIRKLIQKQFPEVNIVPYTEFPYGRGSKGGGSYAIDDDRIIDLVKKKGCNAAIVGNAG